MSGAPGPVLQLVDFLQSATWQQLLVVPVVAYLIFRLQAAMFSLCAHPLSKFPGPRLAAITTSRKAFIEVVLQRSWHVELERLHSKYGPVVRIGPNELHFSNPQAYLDIYNNQNRWDKEETLYHSFGEDRSSFGYLTYAEAKPRKDVLNKSMSANAMGNAAPLVLEKVDLLCTVLAKLASQNKSADLSWAFRCMTMDVITYLCFGRSVDATTHADFAHPLLIAMDASLPVFVIFKHSTLYKNMIMNCPPRLSKILSPPTAGLVDLQTLLKKQIEELKENPEKIANLPHNMTIYHSLMDKDAYRSGTVPSSGSLYEEAQALMFAGADTVGNTLMVAVYYLLQNQDALEKVKSEIKTVWPSATIGGGQAPTLKQLESLPYLNAVIKESLRMNSGVISGLPRVVPATGATIDGSKVPGGTVVSIGSTFVHYNATIFAQPRSFKPERWLASNAKELEQWLVPFSRGPRQCLGINLAWMELRFALAAVLRRFDFSVDERSPKELVIRECFLPEYQGGHVFAGVKVAA